MKKKVLFDGKIMGEDALPLESFFRAIRYGDCLFETIKVAHTQPLFLYRHLMRLKEGRRFFDMLQPELSVDQLVVNIRDLLNTHGFRHARLRLTVWRAGKGFYTPETNTAHYLLEAFESESADFPCTPTGIAEIFNDLRKPKTELNRLKSAQAIVHVLAGNFARHNGFDECFILNHTGNICEGISSNVFAVSGSTLITPSISEDCLPGVMRSFVLENAHHTGLSPREGVLGIDDILTVDEVFFTNAIKGVSPLLQFRKRNYSTRYAEKLAVMLSELVSETVNKTV